MIKNAEPTLSNESITESQPDWEEAMEQARLFKHCLSISNNEHLRRWEKWSGLRVCGLSEEECDELCRPKELDREQVMREVAESIKEERKELEKLNRQNRALRSEENPDKHGMVFDLDDAKLRELRDKLGI